MASLWGSKFFSGADVLINFSEEALKYFNVLLSVHPL